MKKKHYQLKEIIKICKVSKTFVLSCIENEWIVPFDNEGSIFDQEDIARLLLINDLINEMGANDEAVPIILGLVDQIYYLKTKIRNLS
ncbi:MAG: chaperone modulator CbpM [Candidatus Margulisbacteria bacterium]|nr:chaperone modulator CbpM [Candidatus Margulisiibacteriota bacterium]